MQNHIDLIVIGAGPAGCAAATYAARCRWKVTIIDRSVEGGFLGSLGNVSYFPGFPEAISGADLVRRMRRQAELVGAHFLADAIKGIAVDAAPYRVTTDCGKELGSPSVVIASGAAARSNYLHNEREFLGRGVSHDAVADGPAVFKRTAAVIGKSRRAVEEALTLTRYAEKVHFVIPSSKLEIEEGLLRQLQGHRAIELHYSTSLKKINGADHVNAITVFTGGQEKDIPVAGVFTYVHEFQPTTAFLEKAVELGPNGAIKVDDGLATSVPGVFACGDVLCGRPQLPAIAAAQGLLAGIGVDRYLSARG